MFILQLKAWSIIFPEIPPTSIEPRGRQSALCCNSLVLKKCFWLFSYFLHRKLHLEMKTHNWRMQTISSKIIIIVTDKDTCCNIIYIRDALIPFFQAKYDYRCSLSGTQSIAVSNSQTFYIPYCLRKSYILCLPPLHYAWSSGTIYKA